MEQITEKVKKLKKELTSSKIEDDSKESTVEVSKGNVKKPEKKIGKFKKILNNIKKINLQAVSTGFFMSLFWAMKAGWEKAAGSKGGSSGSSSKKGSSGGH